MASRVVALVICSLALLVNVLNGFRTVNQLPRFSANQKIEFEDYSSAENVVVYNNCSGDNATFVGSLDTNSVLLFEQVDFGTGTYGLNLRYAHNYPYAAYEIDLYITFDDIKNLPDTYIPMYYSGGPCQFVTLDGYGWQYSGIHDVYFTFPNGTYGGLLYLDWIQFNLTQSAN